MVKAVGVLSPRLQVFLLLKPSSFSSSSYSLWVLLLIWFHVDWRHAGLHRCGKSCRLRWINYLRPDLKRGNFGQDEEDLIIKLHALLGNRYLSVCCINGSWLIHCNWIFNWLFRWSLIAGRLPGRTDNEVKNYWNSHIRKKLINMGIDPNNHRVNQSFAAPLNRCASAATMSSGSMTGACDNKSLKPSADNDPLSDSASGLEDEISASLDLNLDLTIAIPASSLTDVIDKKRQDTKSIFSREVEGDANPTLILFRWGRWPVDINCFRPAQYPCSKGWQIQTCLGSAKRKKNVLFATIGDGHGHWCKLTSSDEFREEKLNNSAAAKQFILSYRWSLFILSINQVSFFNIKKAPKGAWKWRSESNPDTIDVWEGRGFAFSWLRQTSVIHIPYTIYLI